MATTDLSPFNALVAQVVAAHTHFIPEEIIVLDSPAKYCPEASNENTSVNQSLSANFDTMANVNRMALEDLNLCL